MDKKQLRLLAFVAVERAIVEEFGSMENRIQEVTIEYNDGRRFRITEKGVTDLRPDVKQRIAEVNEMLLPFKDIYNGMKEEDYLCLKCGLVNDFWMSFRGAATVRMKDQDQKEFTIDDIDGITDRNCHHCRDGGYIMRKDYIMELIGGDTSEGS